ncbi:calcium/sodium antiporter [Halopseudomonas bauzanensis]|uniref:Calcium/sodium antiporter n=1 Tax=Halopseudomonas bauzanensis TaxID=653930 RepID=A0A4U0YRZ9_9GAMM|nr:calcium/sodium antiporter [Halopseudomonas bauzanensis]TKA93116.1 calcium/sodium antiporter [Halopseudomonas bauzanensis]
MLLAIAAIIVGLVVLVWSADRFVEGASAAAVHGGMPPLLIGMLIIGFGTSAPELSVSALSSLQGNSGIALGNAWGSNITNIALIIGLVALISPISVHGQVVRRELPILLGITALAGWQVYDGYLSRADGVVLLVVFALLLALSIRDGMRSRDDVVADEIRKQYLADTMPLGKAIMWLVLGLILLIASSRLLVWGSVFIASDLGINDMIIGLTIVAIGTSLPELASSLAAIRKNEHDLALGNIIGSGLFNTLGVVGLAAVINPLAAPPEALTRDWALMAGLTVALLLMCIAWRGRPGRINRVEGAGLLTVFCGYTGLLVWTAMAAAA